MENKVKITMWFDPETAAIINANSTPRGKADFVADCIRRAMRREQDGDGVLERIAAAMEQRAKVMDKQNE